MESRLRIADNAVQPVLLMFPLGLFAIAILFDTATMTGAPRFLGILAYWTIVGGLLGVRVPRIVAPVVHQVASGAGTRPSGNRRRQRAQPRAGWRTRATVGGRARELFEVHFEPVAIEPYTFGGGLWSMVYFQGRTR